MNVLTAWLRVEVRRRWRSLAVLAVLVAVASGTVITAVAGARRAASALTRLQDGTLPATSVMLANDPEFDWSKIRALPGVEALSTFAVRYSFYFEGISHDFGLAGPSLQTSLSGAFAPADDAAMRTIEKPIVFAGRVFDPSRDDEVVVSRHFADHFGKAVGDTLILDLPSPEEVKAGLDGTSEKLTGPRITMHIVGVVSSPWFSDAPDSTGNVVMSPGLVERHPANTIGDPTNRTNPAVVNALVRLRGGESALPQFRTDVRRALGRADIDIWNLPAQRRVQQHQVSFEARCLLAFGAAALLAAVVLVGQAIVRYAGVSVGELNTLRALGLTPGQTVAAAAAGPSLAGIIGGVVGAGGAAVASRWFPIGTTKLFEPAPGTSVDWVVIGPALAVVALLVTAGAVGSSGLAMGAARSTGRGRRSTVATAAARGGLGVPAVIGARFALESGRGPTAVPVRPALIGAVCGVLGVIAALTFWQGVSDATEHSERFGQTFQLGGFVGINGQDYFPPDKVVAQLAANTDIAGVGDIRADVATGPKGNSSLALFSFAHGSKPLDVIVTAGRAPASDNEVMLAPRSLAPLQTRIGSQVTLRGSNGSAVYAVTGIGLVPQGPENAYANGGLLTTAGYDAIFTGFKYHFVLAALRDGADPHTAAAAAAGQITKAVGAPDGGGFSLTMPSPPVELVELRQMRVLPVALGVFLALLATGAVGHALATAARRRAHDIAVLRALGMTQRQCRWVVATQASILAVIGLLFGVPLGLAVGRTVWRAVADYTPLQYVAPTSVWALVLVAPAALLIANVLAALPGRRAARLRISHVLRAE
ncbi:MAG: putative transport system permease protein [Pseudonocardiales bacterium]|nr:putative transport system permease protein [Pseudonocardiales bacterium]